MMVKRPMICVTDTDGKIYPLGGNMRLKALKSALHTKIPEEWIMMADDWTEAQRREFVIKDNLSMGDWDWQLIASDWPEAEDWGLEVWQQPVEVDYSLLDDNDDLDNQLDEMAGGVKKAIQIEFDPDHYVEAYELVKFWRGKGAYVGKMILDFLKSEKGRI